ncbi:MAG TPA: UDP-2,3-diacylglucosamine diphosphatase LpxI [Pirellulales bacterium]|nr:UDP-2,3-diacylglucosamine diphosphatase LpxI [Pirellulales bacterium]
MDNGDTGVEANGVRPGSAEKNMMRTFASGNAADQRANPERIGLIAGWGQYPMKVAESLRRAGSSVYCVALVDHADPALAQVCTELQWTGVARIGHAIRFFKRHQVQHAVMAGKVFKLKLLQPKIWLKLWPDWRTIRIFWSHFIATKKDRRDDTLLLAVVEAFEEAGICIQPATDFVPELLVRVGQLTQLGPTKSQQADIAFGWHLAKEMGRLDIGQSVVVKDRACLAVEAIEGTDECIRRAATLCPGGGFTVVKLAKPQQDMRFDVPTIGLGTLKTMVAAGAKMLVVEGAKTILVDEAEFIAFANQQKLIVVSLDNPGTACGESSDRAA